MPIVATDDEARSLRYRWLGPEGFRAPWDWVFPQWFAGSAIVVLLSLVTFMYHPPLRAWLVLLVIYVAVAVYIAGPQLGKVIATDTGLAYHVLTLLAEITAKRPSRGQTTTVYAPRKGLTRYIKEGNL